MTPASIKNKGRIFQQWVRDQIRATFNLPDSDVESRAMGSAGEDIMLSTRARALFPFTVECKSIAKCVIYKWMAQSRLKSCLGIDPIVVVKANHKDPLVILPWDTFERLIKK